MAKRKHKKQRNGTEQPARGDPAGGGAPFSPHTGQPYLSPAGGGERSPVMSSAVQAGFPYVCSPAPVIKAGHLIYSPPAVMSPKSHRRGGPTSPRGRGANAGVTQIAEELRHDQVASKNRIVVTSAVVFVGVVLIVVIVWARLWRDEALANREPPPVTTSFYSRSGTEGG